jgi:hypothetical protein
MTWFDHCRRAASVLLVVLCLLAIPAVANAKFTSSKPATLSVGTDKMETPTNLTGTYSCSKNGNIEKMSVTFTGFDDAGPAGSTYGFGLALGTTIKDSAYSTVKRQTLEGTRTSDGVATTWTVGIQGYLENWTSAIASENIVCPANATRNGYF